MAGRDCRLFEESDKRPDPSPTRAR